MYVYVHGCTHVLYYAVACNIYYYAFVIVWPYWLDVLQCMLFSIFLPSVCVCVSPLIILVLMRICKAVNNNN